MWSKELTTLSLTESQSKTPSIIFEYVNNTDFKVLYPKFTDFDVVSGASACPSGGR